MDDQAQEVSRYPDVGPQTFDPGPQTAGLVHPKSATVLCEMVTFEEPNMNAPMLANEAQDVKCQQQVEQQAGIDKRLQTQKVRQSQTLSPFFDSACTPHMSSSGRADSDP